MASATTELWKSGTFWTAVAAVAAVAAALAAFITAWVTHRVGTPVRRLVYGIRSQAPLLTAPDGMHAALELRHHGQVITDPYVVEVVLEGRGQRDIPRDAFDNGAPLKLDLGARIVELLQITHDTSTSVPTPPIAVDGSSLAVGPGLVGRRQKIAFTVLVEGEPTLGCDAPLADVSVRPDTPEEPGNVWLSAFVVGMAAVLSLSVLSLSLLGSLSLLASAASAVAVVLWWAMAARAALRWAVTARAAGSLVGAVWARRPRL